jgi:hypothetical protein
MTHAGLADFLARFVSCIALFACSRFKLQKPGMGSGRQAAAPSTTRRQ